MFKYLNVCVCFLVVSCVMVLCDMREQAGAFYANIREFSSQTRC